MIQSLRSKRFPRELEPLGHPPQLHPAVSQRGALCAYPVHLFSVVWPQMSVPPNKALFSFASCDLYKNGLIMYELPCTLIFLLRVLSRYTPIAQCICNSFTLWVYGISSMDISTIYISIFLSMDMSCFCFDWGFVCLFVCLLL